MNTAFKMTWFLSLPSAELEASAPHILSPNCAHLQCHPQHMKINHLGSKYQGLTSMQRIFQYLLSNDMNSLDMQIYSSVYTFDDDLKIA